MKRSVRLALAALALGYIVLSLILVDFTSLYLSTYSFFIDSITTNHQLAVVTRVDFIEQNSVRLDDAYKRIVSIRHNDWVFASGVIYKSSTAETLIITCYHVLDHEDYNLSVESLIGIGPFEVIGANEKLDLAVIRCDFNIDVQPLTILTNPQVGNRAFAVSNPWGMIRSISEGIVSNITQDGIIVYDLDIIGGSSGGGIFDSRGNLYGIIKAMPATLRPVQEVGRDEFGRGVLKDNVIGAVKIPYSGYALAISGEVIREYLTELGIE